MRDLIHAMLVHENRQELITQFRSHHYKALKGKDKDLDKIVATILEFTDNYGVAPTPMTVITELNGHNQVDLSVIVQEIIEEGAPIAPPMLAEFAAAALYHKRLHMENEINLLGVSFQKLISEARASQDPNRYEAVIDKQLATLRTVKTKYSKDTDGQTELVYGSASNKSTLARYLERKDRIERGTLSFYNFDYGTEFHSVLMSPGDMIVYGGYTSQGKSIHLRRQTYRLVTEYGLNVPFLTFEMDLEKVRDLFLVHHANNKTVFPDTPYIESEKLKRAVLTDEEADFLFNVVDKDFTSNPNYGNLLIFQPSKMRYTMEDLSSKIDSIQSDTMPVDSIALDYLTMMSPSDDPRSRETSVQEVNQMIKDFKSLCLTHTDLYGNKRPLIGFTAHQLSRQGYEKALKNEGRYELSAFHLHSEIEKSSDLVLTSLVTPDMRQANKIRVQVLKNRDGEVPFDPVDQFIDYKHGFACGEIKERTLTEIIDTIKSLSI